MPAPTIAWKRPADNGSKPTHFALMAGHENGSIEKTAWETERFVVVEKLVAEELLERTDPRS